MLAQIFSALAEPEPDFDRGAVGMLLNGLHRFGDIAPEALNPEHLSSNHPRQKLFGLMYG
jgi:hypothetical protein